MASIYDCLKPVKSSMFTRAGYDDATWQLLLEFSSTGEIKAYKNVAPEVADECLNAESIGKWWNSTIKGNASWEFEILGADPTPPPPQPKKQEPPPKQPQADLGITVADIQEVDPTYRSGSVIHMSEVADWPPDFGAKEFDPNTGHWPSDAINKDGTVKDEAIEAAMAKLATQPKPEIMPAWTAPESASEALELLSERETEIDAIIASCKETGQAALAIKVTDGDSRVKAAELLTELVTKKDRATELLEPFRKVLYEAYTYAGDRKKAALDPLEGAIKHVKARCIAWDDEQRRLQAEADRKAREAAAEEARRRQEEERQRITLAEMQDRLDEGDVQGAETLFDQPINVPLPYVAPVYVPAAAPVIEGQSTSQKYKVDEAPLETEEGYLESVMKLLRAVREDKIDLRLAATYLKWDLVSLNKLAGALRTAFFVPGLTAVPVSNLSVRRKK